MRASFLRCAVMVVSVAWGSVAVARGQGARRAGGASATGPAVAKVAERAPAAGPVATGPVVVFDTSEGRLTCRLFAKEKPATVALFTGLATGKTAWLDAATNAPVLGKPLYDATVMYGVAAGAAGGRSLNVAPGTGTSSLHPEPAAGLAFDRPGRLAMRVTDGALDGRSFYVLDHAEERRPEIAAGIFGQCDAAAMPVVEAISHKLLRVDNHSPVPVVLNRVAVLEPDAALPTVAAAVPLEQVADAAAMIAPVEPLVSPVPTGPRVTIDTSAGAIHCQLFQETPVATANFVELATGKKPYTDPKTKQVVRGRHFYDGLRFGRVVPDFMIQNADLPNDPSGGETIGFHFDNEIVPRLMFDRPGRLAYANSGPDTNESEFFITESPVARLNGGYTIFGQCDAASQPVVAAIARVPRNVEDHALRPVVIRRVVVE